MDTGVAIFPTHDAIAPADVARLAEERGHESLFFPEHTHIPASRASAWPGGGELPRRYAHTFDLFVAITAAVTATSRLRVGSGICLLVERDPIITAKEVASVDYLSGGRFEFGVGAGWNREEMANHGTDPRRRMAILRERVEAMKAIWTSEEASYAGEHVAFERVWSWPKPAQRPHPPVLVGGNGPGVLDRVLAFGDAWFPNHDRGEVLDRAAELRARADRPVGLMVMGVPADAKVLERYAAAGFGRAVHWLPSAARGPVERALDRYEAAVAELYGELGSSGDPPYAEGVARREACLVDVYDTLLSCDFTALRTELPRLARVSQEAWAEGYRQVAAGLGVGQLTKAEGFGRILAGCGVPVQPGLVRALVERDRELLVGSARLYDDAIPFLEALRSGGIKIAIVSNCVEHTRDVLDHLGITRRADTLVLSCEVGAAKPAPEIFTRALDRLGVAASSALFVDDQAAYCAGGAALGIGAVQIVRGELDGNVPAAGTTVVRSLTEVETLLTASAAARRHRRAPRRTW